MTDQESSLRFASALSTESSTDKAVAETCGKALEQLGGTPDLALLFLSQHHASQAGEVASQVCGALQTDQLLGCTAESIVGTGREIEMEPSMSLWLARLPDVEMHTMHVRFERTAEGGTIIGWPDALNGTWPEHAVLLMLADPFSFPADLLLERLNEDRPGVPVVGGMASGAHSPGGKALLLGRHAFSEGAIAIRICGAVRIRTVVSQGCRPIGRPLVVTKAEQNVIHQLGGKPALLQLKELFDTLPTHEQQLVQSGLHLGRVVSEYQDHFEQGDFLVRNVMGIDPDQGAIAVSDFIRTGQTVQFHIRDQRTADEDLRQLLAGARQAGASPPQGALLFTCNGRGSRLFEQPHHDAAALEKVFGAIPTAGFFAQGELGPIAGRNFMHGFTASLALFSKE